MFDISVIIPVYNAERWIGHAIPSVLNQTVMPAEILVVDDGSTDGTARASQKYGAAIRYFYQQNSGPAVARNLGIDQAESEWIAFLDADDEWLPHKIESQLRILKRNPDLKWCSSAYEEVSNGDATPHTLPDGLKEKSYCHRELSFFSAWLEGVKFRTPSFVIHGSVFNELGGFDAEMLTGEDTDMWERIALKYPQIGYCCNTCWRCHRDNRDSASQRGHRYRDLQLRRLCRNMRRAMLLGPEVVKEFHPYARTKAIDYLIQAAGRECLINADTKEDAKSLFPLTVRERGLLRILRSLPKPIALRAVRRFTL